MTDPEFDLVPSLGRLNIYNSNTPFCKNYFEQEFINKSYDSVHPESLSNKSEYLLAVSAQHHGAPTRLLDWTRSPLIAALFATEAKAESDGSIKAANKDAVIYAAHICQREPKLDLSAEKIPFVDQSEGTVLNVPPAASPRVIAQQSVFTISPDASLPMQKQHSKDVSYVVKYIIPTDKISEFRKALSCLGIRKSSLFPEPDTTNNTIVLETMLEIQRQNECANHMVDELGTWNLELRPSNLTN